MCRQYFTKMPSPCGTLLLVGNGEALTGLRFQDDDEWVAGRGWQEDAAPFAETIRQLEAYFSGERSPFSLPLAPSGTPFQVTVWLALLEIPHGRTTSYGELARRLGKPSAVRAVGAANGHNPIPIIIPCHRVLGADGRLTGYGGGLERKRRLLVLEGVLLA